MGKDTDHFLAPSGQKIKLKDYSTDYTGDLDKEVGEATMESIKEKLSNYQETLYAANNRSVLIIFQAMDAAGKDGSISHVMSGLNP
ncbi:MAG TPA: polyphosphate kinase 2 family protein, partial [Pedobacter sp.]